MAKSRSSKKPPSSKKGASKKSAAKKSDRRRDRPSRAERFEEARRRHNRRVLLGRLAIGGGLAAVVLGIAAVVVVNRARESAWISTAEAGSCSYDTRSDGDAGTGNNHVSNPRYQVNPPAGGNHTTQVAAPGVYDADVVPSDGELVHALEHGYVILWHEPDLSEDELADVLEVRDEFERDVLVVPRPSLPSPVAATAWHRRLICEGAETDALATFVRNARNQGPEAVPH